MISTRETIASVLGVNKTNHRMFLQLNFTFNFLIMVNFHISELKLSELKSENCDKYFRRELILIVSVVNGKQIEKRFPDI